MGSQGTSRVVVQDSVSGREFDWPIPGQVHQTSLRWWPDGKSVIVRRAGARPGSSVVERREAETGNVVGDIAIPGAGGDVVPTRDGSALIYTRANEVREWRLADGQDRVLMTIEKPWFLIQPSGLSVTRDGQQLAVTVARREPLVTAARLLSRPAAVEREIGLQKNLTPVGWAEGGRVLLAMIPDATGDGRGQLLAYDLESNTSRSLGLFAEQLRHFRLHPDERQILFSAGQSRLEYWWLVNADRE